MNDTYMASESDVAHSHVMCQEIGHDWGLDHQDESGADLNTCMDYADALDNPSPNQHDYEQLATIYSHLDSSSPSAALETEKSTSTSAEPIRVRRHEGRGHATVIKTYSDGSKTIRFINYA